MLLKECIVRLVLLLRFLLLWGGLRNSELFGTGLGVHSDNGRLVLLLRCHLLLDLQVLLVCLLLYLHVLLLHELLLLLLLLLFKELLLLHLHLVLHLQV